MRSACFMRPASASAPSPSPRSSRHGPRRRSPSRCPGRRRGGAAAASPTARWCRARRRAVGMLCGSTAIERPGTSATPCAPFGPRAGSGSASSRKKTKRGLLRIMASMRPRVLARPGPDRRPRRFARAQLALLDEPAADRLIGLLVVRREGDAHDLRRRAVHAGEGKPARALDLQQQRIERVAQPCDLAAAQAVLRRRQGLDLLTRPVGFAGREVGRRRIERDPKAGPRAARGLDQRLEVARREADRIVRQRLDAIRPQLALQPLAQRRGRRRRAEPALARLAAGREPRRRRPLAAAQEGEPEIGDAIAAPARQLAPARGDPARARPIDGGSDEIVANDRRQRRRGRRRRRRDGRANNRSLGRRRARARREREQHS